MGLTFKMGFEQTFEVTDLVVMQTQEESVPGRGNGCSKKT